MDRNLTLQVSLEARVPTFWIQSIEFNNLNNFCCICLFKMFTCKKILISTEIRQYRRAFRPVGLFFKNQLIDLNKLNNFCSLCLYKIDIDIYSIFQAGFKNQSIELINLNNFCSLCLYKIFISKKIFKWTEIWLFIRALRPVGLFFKINR